MGEATKRPRDSEDPAEQQPRKQQKFSSYADFEPIIVSDDEDDGADDNYNEVKPDGERKSLAVTLKVRYQPKSTTAMPYHYAAPAIEDEDQMMESTDASVMASKPNHPISNTIRNAEVSATKQEEPATFPDDTELVASLMAAMHINDKGTLQQWLALQVQSNGLIHAHILEEIQKIMLSGAVLVQDNKELRRQGKVRRDLILRASQQIRDDSRKLQTMGEELQTTKEKLQATEGKLHAAEDEAGRIRAQADREKAQDQQTIQELQEQLREYRKIKEAMAAIS